MTALFVQREHNFALAYPTPVLGKPWSIPFEFPLYQWTVVVVSDATGMPLTQAGRAVSAGCFYLALPAAWLLLGRLGLGRSRRLVVLGMVVTCPLYVFYARAFLIETMALMFSLWFLHAFVTAVERRSWGWLVVANVAGVGAGLVKVTTFMLYLMPAGIWAATWLWRARPRRDGTGKNGTALGRTAGWIAAGTMVPFAPTPSRPSTQAAAISCRPRCIRTISARGRRASRRKSGRNMGASSSTISPQCRWWPWRRYWRCCSPAATGGGPSGASACSSRCSCCFPSSTPGMSIILWPTLCC
jgi:hypothetical protein